jgi:hypothetical protein
MRRLLFCILMMSFASIAAAASFTYRGNLQDAGKPADGNYDLEVTLFSAAEGGRVIGGPLLLYAVPVHNGNFSTEADFGSLAKIPDTAWLGVKVRAVGGGEYASLSARSPVNAAIATTASSVCPGAWTLYGNAGNVSGMYLGTADTQPLTFEVNGAVAGQLMPTTSGAYPNAPNVIFGSSQNTASSAVGATIAGGGSTASTCGVFHSSQCSNSAGGLFSSVGGGRANYANGSDAIVGGGHDNFANATESSVGGGSFNTAGNDATVAGGLFNHAIGSYSAIPGGNSNSAGGDYSLAAGSNAYVRAPADIGGGNTTGDQGTFVWSDASSATQFSSSGANQFLVRAGGGVAINGAPFYSNAELTIYGSPTAGSGDTTADLLLIPRGSSSGYDVAVPGDGTFDIFRATTSGVFSGLSLDASGNLTIAGANAFKATAGSWLASSDRRIKQDITPLESAVDTLLQLRPVSFHYTPAYRAAHGDFADHAFLGFVAQEYQTVFPQAVSSSGEPVPGASKSESPVLSIDSEPALVTTVAAVQELAVQTQHRDEEIVRLRADNAELRSKLDALAARLDTLEHDRGSQ